MRSLRFSAAFAASAVAAACSLSDQVAISAVDYNRAVATSNDQILLLNIIRAAKNQPMHFTRIGKITGSFELSVGAEAEFSIGGGSAADTLSPAVGVKTSPTFDIEPLGGKRFWEGFLKPLRLEQFASFWNQGWSKPLLVHLFVEEAIVELPSEENPCWISSDPKRPDTFEDFDAFASALAELRPEAVLLPAAEVGAPLEITKLDDLKSAKAVRDAGFALKPDRQGRLQITAPSGQIGFVSADQSRPADPESATPTAAACDINQIDKLKRIAAAASIAPRPSAPEGFKVDLTLRSVSGVIDYLGEHVAAQINDKKPLTAVNYLRKGGVENIKIFALNRGPAPAVTVAHQGALFSIGGDNDQEDGTLLSLSLAQQLFGLQIEGAEFTPTETVRFLNQ